MASKSHTCPHGRRKDGQHEKPPALSIPHEHTRQNVRALLCGDEHEALAITRQHSRNASFLKHALNLEEDRMNKRKLLLAAIRGLLKEIETN